MTRVKTAVTLRRYAVAINRLLPALLLDGWKCRKSVDKPVPGDIVMLSCAPPSEWDTLLRTARNLGLDVAGISFHVGSGCESIQPFADAVESARIAFDLAQSYGHHPNIVDCGGGFPGTDTGASSHMRSCSLFVDVQKA
jgi:hypothetical protein